MLQKLDVTVVPINIRFDTEEYQEGVTLGYREFFDKVDALGTVPKTSQPSPGAFVEVYRRLAAQGATAILSLHVTGQLSGTVGSAELAAEMVKNDVDVRVFDSLAGSAGTGFMVIEARQLLDKGAGVEDVLDRWRQIRDELRIVFYLDTLRYARMSGRVGAMQSTLASMLQIKPLVILRGGTLEVFERVRTRKVALDRLLDIIAEDLGSTPVNLAVVHAEDLPSAEALLARAQDRLSCRRTFIARLATSLVTNLGIGTLGIVAYPAMIDPL
jgi:DegV family protein with EDD domain